MTLTVCSAAWNFSNLILSVWAEIRVGKNDLKMTCCVSSGTVSQSITLRQNLVTPRTKWHILATVCSHQNEKVCICVAYNNLSDLLRLSSSSSVQNIGRRVVSIWHDHWQCLSRHSIQHPVCPDLLSMCLAMSSLVFRPSSCHLLVSTPRPDWLVWLLRVIGCDQQIVFF